MWSQQDLAAELPKGCVTVHPRTQKWQRKTQEGRECPCRVIRALFFPLTCRKSPLTKVGQNCQDKTKQR